jgi:hypothetical protein
MHQSVRSTQTVQPGLQRSEPTPEQVEAAAKAWMAWQFPGREWETAVESMREKFREGALVVLRAGMSDSLAHNH